jgi:hypothetical protein
MESLIGIGIWVLIFLIWYIRSYPDKVRISNPLAKIKLRWPSRKPAATHRERPRSDSRQDYRSLAEIIERISSSERFDAADAATMVEAVKELMDLEPASGQVWEAFALDALETSEITCDKCKVPVEKTVKKTGVKIQCPKCKRWLALRNSKVTIINPHRSDLEDWEH